jgi:hypothetical protein
MKLPLRRLSPVLVALGQIVFAIWWLSRSKPVVQVKDVARGRVESTIANGRGMAIFHCAAKAANLSSIE